MSLTLDEINVINKLGEYLEAEYEITTNELAEGDDHITIIFPRDEIICKTEVFLKYLTSFKDLQITNKRVGSPLITQIPILSHDFPIDYLLEKYQLKYANGGIKISIIANPILIGIGAVKLDEYSKYCPPCSPYVAVEVEYATLAQKLSEDEERNLVKSYLFEFSHLSGYPINFHEIRDVYWENTEDDDDEESIHDVNVNSLQDYTEGMDLYLKAVESIDAEISFLYYYKIIEFYAPISAKRIAYDSLTRKLDSIRLSAAKNKDIKAIIQIADQHRTSQTDKELAQSILKETMDLVDVFHLLPDDIQKKVSKNSGLNSGQLSYETSPEQIQKSINSLGTILYSTRNSIVHAKSNYTPNQNECKEEDLKQLNVFLKHVTYGIIKWHSRLPQHIKDAN